MLWQQTTSTAQWFPRTGFCPYHMSVHCGGCSSAPHCLPQGPRRNRPSVPLGTLLVIMAEARSGSYLLPGRTRISSQISPAKQVRWAPEFNGLCIITPQEGAVTIDEQQYTLSHHSSTVCFLNLMTLCVRGES